MGKFTDGPVVLTVLDGWGLEAAHDNNGISLANTPNFDRLEATYPHTTLEASGEAVGLPEGQIGNSEVGHTTIGAGTVIYQDLVRISKDAEAGKFSTLPAFGGAFDWAKEHSSQLHIMGLLSMGGVHSHENHFFELIRAAATAGVKRIIIHPFLDGRDSNRTDGEKSLAALEKLLDELGVGRIATVIGRYYAMDRDKNWDRTDKAFEAIAFGKAEHTTDRKPSKAINHHYGQEVFDELMEPHVFTDEQGSSATLEENDAIIFTNFRTDRTKQLSKKICEMVVEKHLSFVTMTDYGQEIESIIAYEPATIEQTLAGVIAEAGLPQVHLAETEKYPHATYFLNGGKEDTYELEEHVLVPSRKDVKTHDEAPEMMAKEICDEAISRLEKNKFMFINFANPDMVGHTANKPAIITAVETVDRELGRLSEAVLAANGVLVVIADHGNAERMIDPETGNAHTAHTTNPVPCIVIGDLKQEISLRSGGGLKDIAPTILELLDLKKPEVMTGESLLN
jgi:2,3-bisphosphoglycerate-independent phosphoglycerate mutase